jgi:hypothetical protein
VRAAVDPKHRTKGDVLRAAGYSESVALTQPGRTLDRAGEAIERYRAERAATARDLKERSSGAIAARIADGSASDALLVSTLKTAHDISKDESDDTEQISPPELRLFDRRRLRDFHRGVRLGIALCQRMGSEAALAAVGRVMNRMEDRLPPLPFRDDTGARRHRRFVAEEP